jgi:hypothetical protein
MSGRLIPLSEQSSASRIALRTVFNGGSRSAARPEDGSAAGGRSAGRAGYGVLLFSALVGQAEALQTWMHDARAEVETWATLTGDACAHTSPLVPGPETRGGRTAPPRRLRHRA